MERENGFFGIIAIIEYNAFIIYDGIFRPEIYQYYTESYYIEKLIQMPIILLTILFGISWVVNLYIDQNNKVKELSYTDALTGVHNRRSIISIIENYINSASNNNVHILLIDIDDFKVINDTYGHLVGDEVMIDLCNVLNEMLDDQCEVGRFGGDEFIIFFKEKSYVEVKKQIELLVQKITSRKVNHTAYTISGGLVSYNNDINVNSLIYRADILLYKAKSHGKNAILFE